MLKLLKVEGHSLYPLLKEGNIVLCLKVFSFNSLKPDDIVVFNYKNSGLNIKKIKFIKNGKYYVLGETSDSIDSRIFGLLEEKELLYKVLFKLK